MTAAPAKPIDVFYSYAHTDERFRKKLVTHLTNLKRQGFITEWYDRDISAGKDWADEINIHLNTAHLILLLISPDFIASEYCYSLEAKRAMERHEAGEARVIPILLRPTDWKGVPFEKLQVLPTDARPVTKWPNRDDAFLDITKGIRNAVEEFNTTLSNISSAYSTQLQPKNESQSLYFWNVPYHRNPFFTGREQLLTRLYNELRVTKAATLTQPQAISGLGGIGKTQIAVEYAYRFRDNYQAILWSRATSRDTLIADFITIAALLHLPEREVQDQDIVVAAVKRWLVSHTGWLLILDNADDVKMVRDFLPMEGKGHILLTTRAQAVGTIANSIEVEEMVREEGSLLLLRRAKLLASDAQLNQATEEDRTQAEAIVTVLGGLPLAIDQAGAYIEETECSLSEYLELYHTHRKELLQWHSSLSRDYPESVATTWSLSFLKIEQINPAAADLLRFCSFLDPDTIPEEIIKKGAADLGPLLEQTAANPLLLNEAIQVLRRFSLIKRDSETKQLNMHRLVQAVLRDGMNVDTQHLWAERTVRAVNTAFPEVEATTWLQCQRCLPQAQACAALIDQYEIRFTEAARLLNQAALYLKDHAQYEQAKPLYQRALAIREKVLGPEHPDTVQILNNLAWLYTRQSLYEQAKPLYQHALAICEKVLGPEHPDTAHCFDGLAKLYEVQGQYEQAEELYQHALTIREKVLGSEHLDTAESLNNLAWLYYRQNQAEKAMPLSERALAIREKILDSEHPDIAHSLNTLALLSHNQGRYEQANALYHRALTIREQVFGSEHFYTIQILHNLALLYKDQGRHEQAEPLFQRALAVYEKVLGPEHPDTAQILENLGLLYHNQFQYAKVEPFYQRALTIREKVLGLEHPDVAWTLENLGLLYHNQFQYDKAEPFYQRALTIREKVLGAEHPDTARSLDDLAVLHHNQFQYDKAESLYQRALTIYEKVLGAENPDTARTLNNLGLLYQAQLQYAKAESLFQRVLTIREKVLGLEHSDTTQTLDNLASLYRIQTHHEQVEQLYQHALVVREKVLGLEHLETARILDKLAALHSTQGQYKQAEPLYQRVLAIREKVLGPQHPDTIRTIDDLADLYIYTLSPDEMKPLETVITGKGKGLDAVELVRQYFAESEVSVLGFPAGNTSTPGRGTESDLLHFTVDDTNGVEQVMLPVFTRTNILKLAMLRNPEWQSVSVLQVDGDALLENIDHDVTVVINPWSLLEFQLSKKATSSADIFDEGQAKRMEALSSDFPLDLDDESFQFDPPTVPSQPPPLDLSMTPFWPSAFGWTNLHPVHTFFRKVRVGVRAKE